MGKTNANTHFIALLQFSFFFVLFFFFCIFIFIFFFPPFSVNIFLKMKLTVVIYVLATALMTMVTKSAAITEQEEATTERGICQWKHSCDNPDYKTRIIQCCRRPKGLNYEKDDEKKEKKKFYPGGFKGFFFWKDLKPTN